jgi:Domain of unknown function (DUF1707)
MDTDAWGFPRGNLRVSDADRDNALSELSRALQAGRITADEFDQRSREVLGARTGTELTAPLADLPVHRVPAAQSTALQRTNRAPANRFVIGASIAAGCLSVISVANAMSPGPTLQQREFIQAFLARHGVSNPILPPTGFNWVGTITPAAIAVLLIGVIIFLRVRARER